MLDNKYWSCASYSDLNESIVWVPLSLISNYVIANI